jgi:hypothetical protein
VQKWHGEYEQQKKRQEARLSQVKRSQPPDQLFYRQRTCDWYAR